MQHRGLRIAGRVALLVLRAVWVSTMVLTPLFAFWLASSMAAFHNASQWLALLAGLLLFPILPVAWDLVFVWRMRHQPERKRFLTRLDRLVLRTLAVCGVFLAILLWGWSGTAFRALAVRGDWMLDGHHGATAERIRGALLAIADRLDERRRSSEFGTSDRPPDPDEIEYEPEVIEVPVTGALEPPRDPSGWPEPEAPDPVVIAIPADAETSVEAVGRHVAERISDPRRLVKALHDYVALRLTYDHATAELSGNARYTERPSQEAADVFAARTAVCEGYAKLLAALGKAAGAEIRYLTGYVRGPLGGVASMVAHADADDAAVEVNLEGEAHAWNAAKIAGRWYLLDATWDDGDDEYSTTYLFTPPSLFILDHLPDDPAWQLRPAPLGAGDFVRQPALRPDVGRLGVTLERPTRSQVTVDGSIEVVFDNPYRVELAGAIGDDLCASTETTIRCDGLGDGQYELHMWGNQTYIGSIWVNSR